MGVSDGMVAYRIAFQASPIILAGGIAQNMPGNILPIVALTQGLDFTLGILAGANIDLDSWWANFEPVVGATLIAQRVGTYPFANQAVAANATIQEPLNVALRMIAPANANGGYLTKLAIMTALQATLTLHNSSGGTYTVATPSFFYTNCLLTNLREVSPPVKQSQVAWQFEFFVPLLTLQQAIQAQNSLLSKITSGVQINGQDPSLFGLQTAVGIQPTGATPTLSPPTLNTPAAFPTNQVSGL